MLQTIEISLPELLERVRAGEIPLNATACVTFETASSNGESKSDPTLAEIEEDRRIYAEFEKNVNETRRACGARTL